MQHTKTVLLSCVAYFTLHQCAVAQPTFSFAKNLKQSHQALIHYMRGNTNADVPEKCGFAAISYAIHNRNHLSIDLQNDLNTVLTRPVTQKTISAGFFCIHYDTIGNNAAAMLDSLHQKIPGSADQYADSVAAIVNYCLTYETQVLGYPPPPSDTGAGGGTEYDIYIADIGDYGYTTPETPINNKANGGTYTSFVTIDNDFQFVLPAVNKGLPALRVTLAHELHHTIQIGNYGYWDNDIFFYEITSVWMEDVVFTDVNDYYQYLTTPQGHFQNPDVPFNSSNFIMYSRCIWAHFAAKRFGRDVMRRSWEEIRSAAPLAAIDNALNKAPYSTSFKSAFAEWTVWNYFTGVRSDSIVYYPEGKNYGDIKRGSIDFTPPALTIGGNLSAFSSHYYDIARQGQTTPFVVSNINLAAAEAGDNTAFPFSLTLNQIQQTNFISTHLDVADPANWHSRTVVGGSTIVDESTVMEPFPNPYRADGSAKISIPINSQQPVAGTLSIYSSDMTQIYSATVTTTYFSFIGEQVFQWNGMSSKNTPAGSGVYIYVIELADQTLKGKFALLRK